METGWLDGFLSSGMLLDMTMGMAIGMVASPLMMRAIKVARYRRKLNKLMNEIAEMRRNSAANVGVGLSLI